MMKRIILEMGTGNDLYGEDYTKAACRAVEDAIRHSSLILFRSLGLDHAGMQVHTTIGVQHPEKVDAELCINLFWMLHANGGMNLHTSMI